MLSRNQVALGVELLAKVVQVSGLSDHAVDLNVVTRVVVRLVDAEII